jgi:hypothetical protein
VLWGPTAGDARLLSAVRAASQRVQQFIQDNP